MLKTLSAYIGEYKRVSIKTPIYIIVEVLMEILIPFVTASIIDKGIQAGDMSKVLMYGGLMLVLCFLRLTTYCWNSGRKICGFGLYRICM